MELTGRVAIVTGGANRLGRAMALALAREGMDLCIHYGQSASEAVQTTQEIRSLGRRAIAVRADLVDDVEAARHVCDATLESLGRADVLVNNAAIFEPDTLASIDDVHFHRHVMINMRGPLTFAQAFMRGRADGRIGHIINMVDWRAARPKPGHLVYTMTKAAVAALTQMLARELAPHVRVNAIAPGAILAPRGADDDYERILASRIPLQAVGKASDVCDALIYLLKSDFQTGNILSVTGGEGL